MTDTHWSICEAIEAATEETIVLVKCKRHLEISHSSASDLFVKFNWTTGDTEVSATNFDVIVGADPRERWVFDATHIHSPQFSNARVISAGAGSVGIVGW
jgi:hypothetical protein